MPGMPVRACEFAFTAGVAGVAVPGAGDLLAQLPQLSFELLQV